MRRPSSPTPRRSQDTRPNTPPLLANAQLRRSSSDASSRPHRFLAKLKNAGTSSSNNSSAIASSSTAGTSPLNLPALTLPAPPSPSLSSTSKLSTSPKTAREMHRGGTMPAQAGLAPNVMSPSNASTVSLTSSLTSTTIMASPATAEPWHVLHVHVLPIFNGEPLRMPIEELNSFMQKHILTEIARSPSRAIGTLEQDMRGLLSRGMMTMNAGLPDSSDQKLLPRLTELWELFWHEILPYVEGIFLPLQTEKPLQQLARSTKTNRPSSPTVADEPGPQPIQAIDVRVLALRSFRDSILLPLCPRLQSLVMPSKDKPSATSGSPAYYPTLQQMLLVLASTSAPAHSGGGQSRSPGEAAVFNLLRAARTPRNNIPSRAYSLARHTSFFAGSTPGDRRGRIARKSIGVKHTKPVRRDSSVDKWDDATPRNAVVYTDDREKELFGSFKSSGLDIEEEGEIEIEQVQTQTQTRVRSNGVDKDRVGGPSGTAGWRAQQHHEVYRDEADEEDARQNDRQVQNIMEKMVGLRA